MLQVVEAPYQYIKSLWPEDIMPVKIQRQWRSIFLAGGISNCPDWQKIFIEQLKTTEANYPDREVVLYNPRRENFDLNHKEESIYQILWEREHIDKCDMIVFWFPQETLCPITLFELGTVLGSMKQRKVFVGIEPRYQRAFDLMVQIPQLMPDVKINWSLNALISEVALSLSQERDKII